MRERELIQIQNDWHKSFNHRFIIIKWEDEEKGHALDWIHSNDWLSFKNEWKTFLSNRIQPNILRESIFPTFIISLFLSYFFRSKLIAKKPSLFAVN